MRRRELAATALLGAWLLGTGSVQGGQEAAASGNARGCWWVSLGPIGVSSIGVLTGVSASYLLQPKGAASVRAAGTMETGPLTVFGSPPDQPVLSCWDVGALYGLHLRAGERFSVTASGGIALAGGVTRGAYLFTRQPFLGNAVRFHEKLTYVTPGVPLQVEAGVLFTRGFGLALAALADVNLQQSWVGGALGVRLGRLRR